MNRRPLSLVLLLAGCVHYVGGLEPRPALPEVQGAPSSVVILDEGIAQRVEISSKVVMDTFRGDLKRGFLNGFPGAVKGEKGESQLTVSRADPAYECVDYVGCFATLKFKGSFNGAGSEPVTFAGTAKSDLCHNLEVCFKTTIERMYEQIFVLVKPEIRPSNARSPRPSTDT